MRKGEPIRIVESQRLQYPKYGEMGYQQEVGKKHYSPKLSAIKKLIFNDKEVPMTKQQHEEYKYQLSNSYAYDPTDNDLTDSRLRDRYNQNYSHLLMPEQFQQAYDKHRSHPDYPTSEQLRQREEQRRRDWQREEWERENGPQQQERRLWEREEWEKEQLRRERERRGRRENYPEDAVWDERDTGDREDIPVRQDRWDRGDIREKEDRRVARQERQPQERIYRNNSVSQPPRRYEYPPSLPGDYMPSIKSRDSLDKMVDPFKPLAARPSPPPLHPNPRQRYLDQLVVSRNHNPTFLNSML